MRRVESLVSHLEVELMTSSADVRVLVSNSRKAYEAVLNVREHGALAHGDGDGDDHPDLVAVFPKRMSISFGCLATAVCWQNPRFHDEAIPFSNAFAALFQMCREPEKSEVSDILEWAPDWQDTKSIVKLIESRKQQQLYHLTLESMGQAVEMARKRPLFLVMVRPACGIEMSQFFPEAYAEAVDEKDMKLLDIVANDVAQG